MSYSISQVWPIDMRGLAQIDTLLECEGIRRDKNLDYICAMYDDDYRVIATGSCFGNTLRCAHLPNVVLHDSGPYIISSATFPSYFLKDEAAVIEGHARLDLSVFTRIAGALNVTARYVGEEPTSQVTGIYNEIMQQELPKAGIKCVILPRKESGGKVISASTVRSCIKGGDFAALRDMVPPSTFDYFISPEAVPVIERIRQTQDVSHY